MAEASNQAYPYLDSYGYVWFDKSGFQQHVWIKDVYTPVQSPCFICGKLTERVDIDYHGTFCNSDECKYTIDEDLRKANEKTKEADSPSAL